MNSDVTAKKKILLVDDEKSIRLSFRRELQPYYDVHLAGSCSEALEALAGERFDLLLTDLVMADDSGLTLLRRAKAGNPELHVVIITGYGEIETVVEAMRLGADDFLLKPCDIEELLRRLAKTFERDDYIARVRLYDKISQSIGILVALVDKAGLIVEANSAWQQACGLSMAKLAGRSLAEVLGQHSLERTILPRLERCLREGEVQHYDLFRFQDGRPRSMVATFNPVASGNTATMAVLAMTDVTDVMAWHQPLLERAEQLELERSVSMEGFMDCDLAAGQARYCAQWKHLLGYGPDTADEDIPQWLDVVHGDDEESLRAALGECLEGLAPAYETSVRLRMASGDWRWFRARGMVVDRAGDSTPRRLVGTLVDIHRWKTREEQALMTIRELEEERTGSRNQRQQLREALEEADTAWKVLQHKRDQDRKILEEQLSDNVVNIIAPLVMRLHKTGLNSDQRPLVEALEKSLGAVTSSFVSDLASRHIGLTPMEIQVASHVKDGKATKEIAEILHLAPETVNVHRKKIRRKLGLSNTAVNLRTFLSSLGQDDGLRP